MTKSVTHESIKNLFDTDTRIRYIIELGQGDYGDVADMIAICYGLNREKIAKVFVSGAFQEHISHFEQFEKGINGLKRISDSACGVLSINIDRTSKDNSIAELIKRRLREHRRRTLGDYPTIKDLNNYEANLTEELKQFEVS